MPRDGEIGAEREAKPRQKRARITATPIPGPPASAPIETRASARKRAKSPPTPRDRPPASAPILGSAEGDDGAKRLSFPSQDTPLVATTVKELRGLRKRRSLCITEVNGSVSRIENLIAGIIGFDKTEQSKKRAFASARSHRLAVEGGAAGDPALSDLRILIKQSAASRVGWLKLRLDYEDEMERLAGMLPVQEFVASARTKGFGLRGLGVIQGWCADPIGEYRTIGGLWKRLGVAVIDGRRQRGVAGKRWNEAEAQKYFYPKLARADVYAFLSDTMLKAQWNGPRLRCCCQDKPTKFKSVAGLPVCLKCGASHDPVDIIPAHAAGPYGEVYGARKAHTLPRVAATADLDDKDDNKWTPARCENDARRVMSKALLRDLWVEWRRATLN